MNSLDISDAPGRLARLRSVLRTHVREVGLVGALLLTWLIFDSTTGGLFLSSRNLSNLSVQFAVTAILAVGIVVVMMTAEIDLSAGASVGICAIFAAQLGTKAGLPAPLVIVAAILIGAVIGLWHGFWVAVAGVPSFIVTLASLLALGGLGLVVTGGETVVMPADLSFIANGVLPTWTVYVIAALFTGAVLALGLREHRVRKAAGLPTQPVMTIVVPTAVTLILGGVAGAVFGSYRGLPVPMLILVIVAAVLAFVVKYTVFGRYLLAAGTDREATRRAGINVTVVRMVPFAIMGVLYGVASLIFATRLGGAPAQGMTGAELDVIAAAVLGGTSLFGGIGRIGGAIIGALLMESLSNGMVLMDVVSFYQQIVVGAMLLIAVFIDVRLRGVRRV